MRSRSSGGKVVVGAAHVGEHRVAAALRYLDCPQHGAHRGLDAPGDVGVPAVLGADVRGIREVVTLLESHDLLRIPLLQERVVLEVAERLRELQLLRRCQLLIAEEQHLPFEQRVPDLVSQLVVEGLGEVHAVHLGPDDLRVRLDLQAGVRPVGPVVGNPADHARTHAPRQRPGQSGLRHAPQSRRDSSG